MDTLDGNAIGGLLYEAFGEEMTAVMAACAACGGVAAIAESVVYPCLPGAVVRCRSCGALLMAITHIHGVNCVDLRGIAALSRAGEGLSQLPLTGSCHCGGKPARRRLSSLYGFIGTAIAGIIIVTTGFTRAPRSPRGNPGDASSYSRDDGQRGRSRGRRRP